ncbi:Carbamoyltransferase [Candidatus Terasakiella magnetica]|uniref:Carbamoyltransferase n=1 Tax=Candidatus Terasakiella magnetica TaxID=1867952 RepID=A0A1C3RG57_9PROT|nr:carbamoyltransferase C-terminal domain-containing protein [Candidatus Terasakiella magnetica]SCA56194.1 Carbamoyltransferase [Candidatus Terasakiella magnetica]
MPLTNHINKKEVILGIGGYTCDSGACLMIDGEIISAVEEERFTRVKHQGGWPTFSIASVLKEAGISKHDIDHVSFCYDPKLRLKNRLPDYLSNMFSAPKASLAMIKHELMFVARFKRQLMKFQKETGCQVHYLRHHLVHAASSFFGSPFEKAAFYTIDMRGEWDTNLWGMGTDNKMKVLGSTSWPHSLGMFYAGITQHLGFGNGDEFKVMGLASYGKPRFVEDMRKVIYPVGDGHFEINEKLFLQHKTYGRGTSSYFSKGFFDLFGPARKKEETVTQEHMDLAASAQLAMEECVYHQLDYIQPRVDVESLCISGGVGLNGVLNNGIYENTPFKHLYIPSVSGDNGLSLGGCLYVRHQILGHKRGKPIMRADYGTHWSTEDVLKLVEPVKLPFEILDDRVGTAAQLILDGNIVGWFQGRMEYGARALGHRSILANPTLSTMKAEINKCVKFREEFRPFAPAVIEEQADKYFHIHDPLPFMTTVCRVKDKGREKLPATTHIDNTSRVQTVNRDCHPLYWDLINKFGEKSGVPVVLNTSFNVMGEPVVENPAQAIKCFLSSGMDALVIENVLLQKKW